ncbi:MAG: ATP-dependent metallopeptidase FtsH/Yme1/Tma family protein, partial [Actinomycetota bacterium]
MKKVLKSPVFYFLILVAAIWAVVSILGRGVGVKNLDYSEFKRRAQQGGIKTIKVLEKSGTLEGELANGERFRSTFLSSERLEQVLEEQNIPHQVDRQNQSVWVSLLTSFLPFIVIIGIIFFLMQQMQGGGNRVMSFGKAKAKLVSKDQPKITFNDVAGVDEA